MISILLWIWLISLATIILFYTVDDDQSGTDEKSHKGLVGFLAPRYGGTPIHLTQMLNAAREAGDGDAENRVHHLRKKFFRNRRTSEEKAAVDAKRKSEFIAKYKQAGEIAYMKTEILKKYGTLTPEQQTIEIAKQIEIDTPPPAPKKKAAKKGGK